MWQDYVIMAIQVLFCGALMPAVFGRVKPDRWTCFFNAVLLFALAFVFATLELVWATVSASMVAVMWAILLIQPRRYVTLHAGSPHELKEMKATFTCFKDRGVEGN